MAARLTDETIAQIRSLAVGGMARNEIARQLHVSAAIVTKYAPTSSFDRSATAAAVRAHKIDAAARRAVQRDRYLDIIDDVQARALAAYEQTALAGVEGDVRRWSTDRPPARETAELVKAANMATMAELRISDHDSDGGLDEARSVLDGFMDAVARRASELDPQ